MEFEIADFIVVVSGYTLLLLTSGLVVTKTVSDVMGSHSAG